MHRIPECVVRHVPEEQTHETSNGGNIGTEPVAVFTWTGLSLQLIYVQMQQVIFICAILAATAAAFD